MNNQLAHPSRAWSANRHPRPVPRGERVLRLRDGMHLFTRWVGRTTEGRNPLICVHGGPGAVAHDGLQPLEQIAASGRQVIFYDQIGVGRSSPPPDADEWGFGLAIEELDAIRAAYGLSEVHVLGHSYGGYVVQEYAISAPRGLRGIVLADTSCDIDAYIEDGWRIRERLPVEVQQIMAQHEAAGTIEHPDYQDAYAAFTDIFLCKLRPTPAPIVQGRDGANPEMAAVLWGRTGWTFNLTGRLRGWSARDRLGSVVVPALVITGEDDMASPRLAQMTASALPHAEVVVIEGGSHTPYYEDPDGFCGAVTRFLDRVDGLG